ncbi:transcription antitermination factor NusB [Aestuariivirga litoralis]|uniref:Transcription antitermination protein NusB n=1 Tax=Aestuariivirga litoralis TaxID=2650924 RepID=A0A2W2BSD2_9HYPH|nr:transcription antitermination factor NusB [Aestuariivirga litoralis]PZF76356.1 transcription antitermination factor NusB [Aestuariivirga litoralis]
MSDNDSNKYPRERRSAARLGAVQALYQMDLSGSDVGETLAQFSSRASGENFEDGQCGEADYRHLKEVVDGVVREQKAIDPTVDKILDKDWPLHRLDSTVRAILRAGAYELMFMERVPAKVAISEYVDVADAFFGPEEPRFVNGVLNKLARQSRPKEFTA